MSPELWRSFNQKVCGLLHQAHVDLLRYFNRGCTVNLHDLNLRFRHSGRQTCFNRRLSFRDYSEYFLGLLLNCKSLASNQHSAVRVTLLSPLVAGSLGQIYQSALESIGYSIRGAQQLQGVGGFPSGSTSFLP